MKKLLQTPRSWVGWSSLKLTADKAETASLTLNAVGAVAAEAAAVAAVAEAGEVSTPAKLKGG